MTRLVHLSDLHVASDGFVPEWGQRVLEAVNASPPDVLLVTGDLVDDGFERQYERLAQYLGDFQAGKKIVLDDRAVLTEHDVRHETRRSQSLPLRLRGRREASRAVA